MLNSVSVSISEDGGDVAGMTRVRPRHKRKKPRPGGRREILPRAARTAIRWWPVLLFLPAIVLLFEISRVVRKLPDDDRPNLSASSKEEESPRNLNRLDRMTRVVHGVREPCLKILNAEQIEKLEFPASAEADFPAKSVLYKIETGEHHVEGNDTFMPKTETARFNLFTGYPTLGEREQSFKVNETAAVHCGFYSERGGFKIPDADKDYLKTCKVAVSTCAFGGGDDLYQPIGMTYASLKKVCYVAFWDEVTLSSQQKNGKVIGEDQFIGKWRIVVVKDLPFSDQRLNGKIPKMLSHRLFPNARFSIWVDSKSQFRRDPIGVLEALLWRTNSVLAISEHGARSSLYDEAKAVIKKHKATPEEVEIQLNQYRQDGIPDEKRLNGKKALAEASVIVREHTPSTNIFMCLWFNEVVRFTSRDQLSFPYVLRRLKIPRVNMFPVCTRKDLVNSIGHTRKVKPLVKQTS
ncbi:putative hexosyltransferase MUCI70 [Curcuma longa]|uniref:putative hexosyltransferase MUCI70 n=1 Tax=Curcuma longa TaxID=136217 RepID=UPI003D9DB555